MTDLPGLRSKKVGRSARTDKEPVMTIPTYPNITPALTIRPMSKALETAIENAVREQAQAALFPPVEETATARPVSGATRLDARA